MNDFAKNHGYALVVKRSHVDKLGAKRRVILACDRHGTKRQHNQCNGIRPNVSTRKCGCNMQINLIRNYEDKKWTVQLTGTEEEHNHPPTKSVQSHPMHRRNDMTPEIRQSIVSDSQTGVTANQTLAALSTANPSIAITQRDVYNVRQHSISAALGGKTKIEVLLSMLSEDDFFFKVKKDTNHKVTQLFFAYRAAINIYKSNPDVIMMDCTYKTNRYHMPLLNIVGISGMNTTIHIAQCFMSGEKKDDYVWALQSLKKLIDQHSIELPQVFFVDRELSLLNALEELFPNIPVLLCLWHIIKDVESHARKNSFPQVVDNRRSTSHSLVRMDSIQHRDFCNTFILLIRADTEEEYECQLQSMYAASEAEAAYVSETWLDIWKYRIVSYWTNKTLHFGMQSISRVEGYHSTLKKWLLSSRGDLLSVFNVMKHWWKVSTDRHLTAVSNETVKTKSSLTKPIFDLVRNSITSYALGQCLKMPENIPTQSCRQQFTKATGLPCKHKLYDLKRTSGMLQPSDFHAHWWIDRFDTVPASAAVSIEPDTIQQGRGRRRRLRNHSQEHQRGSGVNGTRRLPSSFELSTSNHYGDLVLHTPMDNYNGPDERAMALTTISNSNDAPEDWILPL